MIKVIGFMSAGPGSSLVACKPVEAPHWRNVSWQLHNDVIDGYMMMSAGSLMLHSVEYCLEQTGGQL
jgi:hypothetical protein